MNRLITSMAIAAALVTVARADHSDNDGRRGRPRVILYEHADFRGAAIVLEPGEKLEDLGRIAFENGSSANDRVSSIRVERGASVLVSTHSRFRGDSLRLTESVRNLSDLGCGPSGDSWNDRISSIRTVAGRADTGRGDRWVDVDKIVIRAYQDVLGRDPESSGLRSYRSRLIDDNWSERQLRDELRRSSEYRGEVVNRIIIRSYAEVLGREPDARGLDHYRDQIIRHGVSEGKLREDLRRSAEFRDRSKTPARKPTDRDQAPSERNDNNTRNRATQLN